MPERHLSIRSVAERNALVEQWQYLPRFVAGRLTRVPAIRRAIRCEADFEDLVASGTMALLRAADLWDETKGVQFITYAVHAIRNLMLRHLEYNRRLIHVPVSWHKRRPELLAPARLPCEDTLEAAPEAEAEELPDLTKPLAKLGETDRQILLAHIAQGEARASVALRHGMTKWAVRMRVKKALKVLRKELVAEQG